MKNVCAHEAIWTNSDLYAALNEILWGKYCWIFFVRHCINFLSTKLYRLTLWSLLLNYMELINMFSLGQIYGDRNSSREKLVFYSRNQFFELFFHLNRAMNVNKNCTMSSMLSNNNFIEYLILRLAKKLILIWGPKTRNVGKFELYHILYNRWESHRWIFWNALRSQFDL